MLPWQKIRDCDDDEGDDDHEFDEDDDGGDDDDDHHHEGDEEDDDDHHKGDEDDHHHEGDDHAVVSMSAWWVINNNNIATNKLQPRHYNMLMRASGPHKYDLIVIYYANESTDTMSSENVPLRSPIKGTNKLFSSSCTSSLVTSSWRINDSKLLIKYA